jgi:hypothetical protein
MRIPTVPSEFGDDQRVMLGEGVEHRLKHLPGRHQPVNEKQWWARTELPHEQVAHDRGVSAGAKDSEGNTLWR